MSINEIFQFSLAHQSCAPTSPLKVEAGDEAPLTRLARALWLPAIAHEAGMLYLQRRQDDGASGDDGCGRMIQAFFLGYLKCRRGLAVGRGESVGIVKAHDERVTHARYINI